MRKTIKKSVKKAQGGYTFSKSLAEDIPSDKTGLLNFAERKQNTADSLHNEYYRKFNLSEKLRKNKATRAKADSIRSSAMSDLSNYDFENTRAKNARRDASLMQKKKGGSVKKVMRSGGKITKAKTGTIVPKKSSVSKRVGSAKKSVGNRSMKRK